MAFKILQADITTLNVDAIVNPTDQHYSGGGGLDRQIHKICGQVLYEATDKLPKLHLGEAKVTDSFGLPCKYIIHTSGPHWTGVSSLESAVLGSCYRNSLVLANSLGCKSIAFPLIASQGKHFPKELAFTVAINAIEECLQEYPSINIILTLFGGGAETIPSELLEKVCQFVNDSYIPDDEYIEEFSIDSLDVSEPSFDTCASYKVEPLIEIGKKGFVNESEVESFNEDLIKKLINKPTQANLDKIPIDETFGAMLSRILKERNLPNSSVQDEIGMSGVGFWKLLTGETSPKKMTVFGIAIALELSIDETKEMLMKAGYAINQSSLQDIIVSGLIQNKIYDRNVIDDLLYSLDLQPLPGS